MPLRPWMLAVPLMSAACGSPGSACPGADALAEVEIAFVRVHDDGRRELRGASLGGLDVPLLCGSEPVSPTRILGWSADGESLAIVESVDDEAWVSVVDVAASGVDRIGPGTSGRWSPAGRRLAFYDWGTWGPDGEELIVHLDRDTEGGLVKGTYRLGLDGASERIADARDAEWSPDGRFLAYPGPYMDEGFYRVVHVRELATGDVSLLDGLLGMNPGHPRWSFDGALVAGGMWEFHCVSDSCNAVGVLALAGQGGMLVGQSTLEFAWSPRDTRIVVAEPLDIVTGRGPKRLQVRRGSGDEVLTAATDEDPWSDESPAWRP